MQGYESQMIVKNYLTLYMDLMHNNAIGEYNINSVAHVWNFMSVKSSWELMFTCWCHADFK